jgi:transcriptional regulator with XRE-family HTH domain
VSPGELLHTVRRRHGLTQAQLAVRARTSQAAISRIERGLVSPSVATLANLLELMGEELVLDAAPIDYELEGTLFHETLATTPSGRSGHGTDLSNVVLPTAGTARRPT